MNEITIKDAPAEVVKLYPKASDLFKKYDINFCCNGANPLEQTFAENQLLNEEQIMFELNKSYTEWKRAGEQSIDWDAVSNTEITDHLRKKYYSFIGKELIPLEEFVTRIYHVHGRHQKHLETLYKQYQTFKQEIGTHMHTTENQVLPLIKQYDSDPSETIYKELTEKINLCKKSLKNLEDILREIRITTNDLELPPNACGSYQVTYARLEELEEYTLNQIHLENNILYERFN